MLGDLVYEAEGKVNGFKRLTNGKILQKVAKRGRFLREEFSAIYYPVGEIRPDGTAYVELSGEFSVKREETMRNSAIGSGRIRPDGSMIHKGRACYYGPPGKFARLNGIAVAGELETGDAGNVRGRGWEWK